ncbi:hypothetical protein AJ78_08986, partial [Emergomyces pasteurianus Ep9510]
SSLPQGAYFLRDVDTAWDSIFVAFSLKILTLLKELASPRGSLSQGAYFLRDADTACFCCLFTQNSGAPEGAYFPRDADTVWGSIIAAFSCNIVTLPEGSPSPAFSQSPNSHRGAIVLVVGHHFTDSRGDHIRAFRADGQDVEKQADG